MKIEKLHDFHDIDYVRNWAKEKAPTEERVQLFHDISDFIKEENTILELGLGPGFLADFILSKFEDINYIALDFSEEMIQIAEERLGKQAKRCSFIQGDLTKADWSQTIPTQPDIIITTWTLHDLFNKTNIKNAYQEVYSLLPEKGIFLNGDFIKPKGSSFEYEGGRLTIDEHISLLHDVGFKKSDCIAQYETNIEEPTPSNNYVLFKAER